MFECCLIDYISAFNTVIPYKLTNKLYFLGVPPTQYNWVQDFKLYTLFTHDCVTYQNNTSIIKFADDTTVIGLKQEVIDQHTGEKWLT